MRVCPLRPGREVLYTRLSHQGWKHTKRVGHMYTDYTDRIDHTITKRIDRIDHIDHTCHMYTDLDQTDQVYHNYPDYYYSSPNI